MLRTCGLFFLVISLYCADALASDAAPRIGVSGQSASSPSVIAIMAVLRFAGADPIYLGDHASRNPQADIQSLDGLVVAGNNYDIDPAVYGAKQAEQTVNEMDKGSEASARANYEYRLIELALNRRTPLLGICGGLQRINVGGPKETQGTLVQHVPDNNQWKKGIPLFKPSDNIKIVDGTVLSGLAQMASASSKKQSYWPENSLHHQAVGHVRQGFKISAYNKDGVIEAIEPDPSGPYAGQFVLGVQWHPEYGASPLMRGIFEGLVDASKRQAR